MRPVVRRRAGRGDGQDSASESDVQPDEILGVHMVGPSVSEMIGEYCVAMEFAASSDDIALICHPHPTRSEALRQAAMGVEGWIMQA